MEITTKKYFIYVHHNHQIVQIVTDDKKELHDYDCFDFHNVFMLSKHSNQYRDYLMKEFKLDKNKSFLKALEESLNAKRN